MTWKHKYLWLFGIFASVLSSGGAGAWDMLYNNASMLFNQPRYVNDLNVLYTSKTLQLVFGNVGKFFSDPNILSLLTLVIILAIFLLFLWLSLSSQGAIINATKAFTDNKPTNIEQDFVVGHSSFWRLLGLQALAQLAIYGTLLIIGIPFVWVFLAKGTQVLTDIFFVISFIVLLPLAIIIYFILTFASIYTVLQKTSIIESATKAWKLFKTKWIESLEFALLLFVINIVIALFFVLLIGVPMVGIFFNKDLITNYVIVSLILMLAVFLIVNGALTAFQFVATVMFVQKIQTETTHSKVVLFFQKLFRKKQAI
jgi:hypothetical protein